MYLLEVWQGSKKKISIPYLDYNDASKAESLIDFEKYDVWTQIVDCLSKDGINQLVEESTE